MKNSATVEMRARVYRDLTCIGANVYCTSCKFSFFVCITTPKSIRVDKQGTIHGTCLSCGGEYKIPKGVEQCQASKS